MLIGPPRPRIWASGYDGDGLYRGGDRDFYYIDHADFKTTHRYKVSREEMRIREDLPVGEVLWPLELRGATARRAR